MRNIALALSILTGSAVRVCAAPSVVALLLNPEANAAKRRAVLEVKVKGATLEDPAVPGAVHLLVRLDKETPIATAHTRIAFHGLGPGPHTITVALVDGDDQPLGAEDAVWLTVSPPVQP